MTIISEIAARQLDAPATPPPNSIAGVRQDHPCGSRSPFNLGQRVAVLGSELTGKVHAIFDGPPAVVVMMTANNRRRAVLAADLVAR